MIIVNILFFILCCYYVSFVIIYKDKEFYYRFNQVIQSLGALCITIFSGFMSLNTGWLGVLFEGDTLTAYELLCLIFFVVATLFYIAAFFVVICKFGDSPIYKLIEYYKNINDKNVPKISYSLFRKMFLLHPDYFRFECPYNEKDYETLLAIYYHNEKISFRFIDYLLMLDFVRRYAEEDKCKKKNKKASKVYKLMQDDLEKDRIKAKEDTEKALKEIEDASKKSIEIISRIT